MKKLNVTTKLKYQAFFIDKNITEKELSVIFNVKITDIHYDKFWIKIKLHKGITSRLNKTEFTIFYDSYLVKQYLDRKLIDILEMPKCRFNKYFTVLNESS